MAEPRTPRHADDRPNPPVNLCPVCESAALIGRHCKMICPGCGYVESCEDSFVPNQLTPQGELGPNTPRDPAE